MPPRQSRARFSISFNSRVTCASGSTTRSCVSIRTKKSSDSERASRSFRTASRLQRRTRARLVESIETALRFGKDRINVVPISETGFRKPESEEPPKRRDKVFPKSVESEIAEMPFSTGWHCAHCDLDIRPPTPGLFSFNNPLGACPEVPRLRPNDRDRSEPRDPRSQPEHRRRGGARFSRTAIWRIAEGSAARLRPGGDRRPHAFRGTAESRPGFCHQWRSAGRRHRRGRLAENDRWYGVRGFFKWLESKTYKMHVRVLLSRYRAYTTCPDCNGGRFQPAALNYKLRIVGREPQRTGKPQWQHRAANAAGTRAAFDF